MMKGIRSRMDAEVVKGLPRRVDGSGNQHDVLLACIRDRSVDRVPYKGDGLGLGVGCESRGDLVGRERRCVFGRHAYTWDARGPRAAAIPFRSLSFKMPTTREIFRFESRSAMEVARASVAGRLWAPSTRTRGRSRTGSRRAGQWVDAMPRRIASSETANPCCRSSVRAVTASVTFSAWKARSC